MTPTTCPVIMQTGVVPSFPKCIPVEKENILPIAIPVEDCLGLIENLRTEILSVLHSYYEALLAIFVSEEHFCSLVISFISNYFDRKTVLVSQKLSQDIVFSAFGEKFFILAE